MDVAQVFSEEGKRRSEWHRRRIQMSTEQALHRVVDCLKCKLDFRGMDVIPYYYWRHQQ